MCRQIFTVSVVVDQDNSILNKIANCDTQVKWRAGCKVTDSHLNGALYLHLNPGGILEKGNHSHGINVSEDEFLKKVIFYYGSKSRD